LGGGLTDFRHLLTLSTFGWLLLIGGDIKGIYDILLIKFQKVRLPEEARTDENLEHQGRRNTSDSRNCIQD